MQRRGLVVGAVVASSAFAAALSARRRAYGTPRGASLEDDLRPLLARHKLLPALAAAVIQNGEMTRAAAVGTRRAGADAPVGADDRFHIGSNTKAMTAFLAGMLVEQGALRWDSTVAAVFPDLAAIMDAGLRTVTLEQLLSHSGGVQGPGEAFNRVLAGSLSQRGLNLDELRFWMVREWCGHPLVAAPGTAYVYSNMGYVIAGAMLERVTSRTWEELIAERIFDLLGLHSAGFGPQAVLGWTDAPLGHLVRPDGTLKPMVGGPDADNPAVLGPSGTVHLSMVDYASWAALHATEGQRGPDLVRPDTLRKLHARVIDIPEPNAAPGPARSGYALGWITATLPDGRGTLLTHTGSNTMNTASILLEPARSFGLVVATNVGGDGAVAALEAVLVDLHARYGQA